MICRKIDGFDCRRLLGDVIDQSSGRGNAAFHPGNTLQKFDALLVLERNILFAGNRQAIDLKAGGEIDRNSANLEITLITDRSVVFAD